MQTRVKPFFPRNLFIFANGELSVYAQTLGKEGLCSSTVKSRSVFYLSGGSGTAAQERCLRIVGNAVVVVYPPPWKNRVSGRVSEGAKRRARTNIFAAYTGLSGTWFARIIELEQNRRSSKLSKH